MAEAIKKKIKSGKSKRKAPKIDNDDVLDLIDFGDEEEETVKPKKKKTTKSLAQSAVQKINAIKQELNEEVVEREEVLDDIFRALATRENILLLGPPGTAKSYLAKLLLRHIDNARGFSWLMNRTTDPADIIGPYSVKGMENDKFYRVTTGKAPEAHVFFIDEIFKANEPVLNYMLPMLNEHVIYNDGKEVPVDLRLAIGASNEYPENEDLEAFYDRFVFRHWLQYVQDSNNRLKMSDSYREGNNPKVAKIKTITKITLEEIDALVEEVKTVEFPKQVTKMYDKMIRSLAAESIFISDRRYNKGQHVMMANAFLNGRDKVSSDDFKALTFMLWNKDTKEIDIVADQLGKFVNPYEAKIKEFVRKAKEVETHVIQIENRSERAGEAVQANINLQDILDKVEKEIDDAYDNGVETAGLKKMFDEIGGMMANVTNTCLKQNNARGERKW